MITERYQLARRYRALSRIITGIYAQDRAPDAKLMREWRTLRAKLCTNYARHRTRSS